MLQRAGLTPLQVLYAATVGGRALNGLGEATAPGPGTAADLIFTEGNPLEDWSVLPEPRGVMTSAASSARSLRRTRARIRR